MRKSSGRSTSSAQVLGQSCGQALCTKVDGFFMAGL
jgi:hypothetical protein